MPMTDDIARIGAPVRDLPFSAYNPVTGQFETRSLSAFGGKWLVLFFYPADFSFACPKELAELAEYHQQLADLGVEVVSVSTDSPLAHLHWRTTEPILDKVGFLMASDQSGALSRYFGAYDAERGVARRGTFVLNAEGVLVCMEMNFYNCGRSGAELARRLEASLHLAAHGEDGCPVPLVRTADAVTDAPTGVDDSLSEMYSRQSADKS